MQRVDADVEREPHESEPGEDYYDAIRESGTEVTELQRGHAFRRRGIHQVRRLCAWQKKETLDELHPFFPG